MILGVCCLKKNQWDTRSELDNTHESLDFTPRFKPALNTLAKWYGEPTESK